MHAPSIIRKTNKAGLAVAAALAVSALTLAWSPLPAAAADSSHAAADLGAVNINNGFADLVLAVKPAVVNISTTGRAPSPGNRPELHGQMPHGQMPHGQTPQFEEFFRRFFGEPPEGLRRDRKVRPHERKTTAVGSGFIIDPDGLVVTNYHVIENADEIEVVFDDGTRRPATLKGRDKKTDLALLEITADKPLPFVKFGDSDAARVGDWVIAIGNPFGLGGTTTSGIISARGRDIQAGPLDDFIQIDAPINRGNSGGPLFNTKGEVIGVNSAIYSPNGGSVGIGFAIPASMVSNVIAQLRDNGVVQRGFLGVHIQAVSEEIAESLGLKKPAGALVTRVAADSPAEKAGIQAGDVILTYDGKKVSKMRDLPKLVALTENKTKVDIVIWRNDRRKTLRVAIGSSEQEIAAGLPEDDAESSGLGLSARALNDETRKQYGIDTDAGVVIVTVDPNGAAAGRGLRVGDLIKRIGNRQINTPKEMKAAVKSARKAGKKSVLLLIERDRQTRFVVVPINS